MAILNAHPSFDRFGPGYALRAGRRLWIGTGVLAWRSGAAVRKIGYWVCMKGQREVIKHEPTFMLGVLSGLVWPQIRVEIEVTAVRPARG
jgi:hypothetical protein